MRVGPILRIASRAARFAALAVTIARLARPGGPPPPPRRGTQQPRSSVSVVIPARDEAVRIGPCLEALRSVGGSEQVEVIVVDDQSSDDTASVAAAAGARVVHGAARPSGWAGKPWAVQQGVQAAGGSVIVTLDADTVPAPGLVEFLVARLDDGFDLVTVAGRFDCPTPASRWLHASMLTTLVYRYGRPDPNGAPERPSLANGQCTAFRRDEFLAIGGLALVADSLVEDVAFARAVAARGWRVGFVPGEELLTVRMFESFAATWSGWGRSIALGGVEPRSRQLADLAVLGAVQAAPLVRLAFRRADLLDAVAVALRAGTLAGTARAYTRRDAAYWASPLADPLAVARLAWSIVRPPRSWRGRTYAPPR